MQYQNTWTQDLEDGITTLSMTLDLAIPLICNNWESKWEELMHHKLQAPLVPGVNLI
jgi:hypothetical protein